MSRSRHKNRATGGRAPEADIYAGADSNVMKAAKERKRGGGLMLKGEGEKAKSRSDRPARANGGPMLYAKGGRAAHSDVAEDKAMIKGMIKPSAFKAGSVRGRKRGGGVGADTMPLTTASKVKHITPGEMSEEGVESD